MRIEIEKFEPLSKILGARIEKVTLSNNTGLSVELLTYGCLMLSLNVPDQFGYVENVVMTYDNMEAYAKNPIYLNTTIGLNAGRLKHGAFKIGSNSYQTEINEGISNLHGGSKGLHKQIWTLGNEDIFVDHCEITLKTTHEHESDGYPGNIDIESKYTLYDDNTLKITFSAISDRDCHINMTNHNYFNLSGNEKRKIDEHLLFLNASFYHKTDEYGIPLLPKIQTKNSDYDFCQLIPILNAYRSPSKGIDHPFSLEEKIGEDKPDVIYHDPISLRTMEMRTNQNCVVVYTNNLDFKNHRGICFEAQQVPNQLNVIEAGEKYNHETTYRFGIGK